MRKLTFALYAFWNDAIESIKHHLWSESCPFSKLTMNLEKKRVYRKTSLNKSKWNDLDTYRR